MNFVRLRWTLVLATSVLASAGSLARGQTPTRLEWTFDEAVTSAIEQHPLVEAARARISAAQGTRQTAGTLPNPIATYWLENSSFPGQHLPFGVSRETSTYVTLPLEPLFQRAPRIRRADEEIRAADAGLTTARRQVALDVAHAFFRVALEQVSVQTAEENRAGLERLVTYNRSRVTEGATAELDLIRTQVELDRAATNVALADVDLARSRAELWPFLGATGTVPASFRVTLPSAAPTANALSPLIDFVTQARQRRPELVAARARASAANAETAYQRRLTVRQLGATFGFKHASGSNSATDSNNSLIAGVSVPIPLFDRNRGEIQRATGEFVAAEQELAWAERAIAAEVQGAYDAAQRLSAQMSSLQGSYIDRADEANRITLAAYQEGAASLLQVLDASRTLAEVRLTYYRALFAQRQSVFDLALAAGNEPVAALSIVQTSRVTSPNGLGQKGDGR